MSIDFRDKTPVRRANSDDSVTRHQQHKPDLRIDFHHHCGYCHSHDRYKHTYFEVDHFIPLNFININGDISSTCYKNLVYSCRYCNNAKRKNWPSNSETKFHRKNEGFIDPCDKNYSNQFYRCDRGRIYPNPRSEVGPWMYNIFKFSIRERQIELVWQLERLDNAIQGLLKEQKKHLNGSDIWSSIEATLIPSFRLYYEYDRELRNF